MQSLLSENSENITYSERLSIALRTLHEMHMWRIILSSVACLVLQYFSTLSHKWYDLKKKLQAENACFDFLYNFRLKHFPF